MAAGPSRRGRMCGVRPPSGGEDRSRRFGTEQRWLGRLSDPRGSPHLERMYYERASPSSLFRTNFLNRLSGVAGVRQASRSQSRVDTAYTVPTDAETQVISITTRFAEPCEM